jgi:hypothetical protein
MSETLPYIQGPTPEQTSAILWLAVAITIALFLLYPFTRRWDTG